MEPNKAKPEPDSVSNVPATGPADIDVNEVLDWDFRAEVRTSRPVTVVETDVVRIGRAKPIPLPDPRARDAG